MTTASRPSNFTFLAVEWPDLAAEARRAEAYAAGDPKASCVISRSTVETTVRWLYDVDDTLRTPYERTLAAMLREPTFRQLVGVDLQNKIDVIRRAGNVAVHEPTRPLPSKTSYAVLRSLFHVLYWVARTYTRRPGSIPDLQFDPQIVPRPEKIRARNQAELKALADEIAARDEQLAAARAANTSLEAELERVKAEIRTVKAANTRVPDVHDYDEAATRDAYIDVLLRESGWYLTDERDTEYPVSGMPDADGNLTGQGRVDYVLWGDDGRPLALVEAKRTRRDAVVGQQQAKLYADCLEQQFGRRPIIYCTNGNEHWVWDDGGYSRGEGYPPRRVQGFATHDELQRWHARRTDRRPLVGAPLPTHIAGRPYQLHAIRAVADAFDRDHDRSALLVMATGTGKTRTVIGMVDVLMKAGWVKNVLFLADRKALVRQAANAFRDALPDVPVVNLLEDKSTPGRVVVSTYPTILHRINQVDDETRPFGPGHFDLVIIDEAHRSVYQKYRQIFAYFDALLIGLTATPKDEVDRNTYSLFQLQDGVPTYSYSLEEAIDQDYLVPPAVLDAPLKFVRRGVRYDDLDEEEKDQWDAADWGEDDPPHEVDGEAVNRWLFNIDTVDQALGLLMEHGRKVAGGDRIAKTIVFAKNQQHAQFIVERFDAAYPHLAGRTARVVTHATEYAQNLIDDFSDTEKRPDIAVSVDMLDTGIDVPDVANLVLFKRVHSAAKFWQMIGRGTRLRPDLYGPGEDKEDFLVLDLLGNVEWFNQNLPRTAGRVSRSLHGRLFETRVALLRTLDTTISDADAGSADEHSALRAAFARRLHAIVAGMPLDNILVRPARRSVVAYSAAEAWTPEAWGHLDDQAVGDVVDDLAELPTADRGDGTDEKAKRFDLMMFTCQLGVLRPETHDPRAVSAVQEIAAGLLEQTSIPAVLAQAEWLERLAGDEWWQDVTAPMLDVARLRVRGLVHLLARTRQNVIYTDFADQLGDVREVSVDVVHGAVDQRKFREKARAYLRAHTDHVALQKLRRNRPLTPQDLGALEEMLVDAGVGNEAQVAQAAETAKGLGHFVRSLVGLDRSAVEEAFVDFLDTGTATREQVDFVMIVVDHLTHNGELDPQLLWTSPFTDDAPGGPGDLFEDPAPLIAAIRTFSAHAEPKVAS